MKYLIVIPLLVCGLNFAAGQKSILKGTEITSFKAEKLDQELISYQVFKIDTEKLNNLVRSDQASLLLHFQLGDQYNWPLELTAKEIRGHNYQLRAQTPAGIEVLPAGKAKSYNGTVLHPSGGKADFTFDKNFMLGSLKWKGHRYFLEPVGRFDRSAPDSYFVLYESEDVKDVKGATCGAHAMHMESRSPGGHGHGIQLRESQQACLQANVALAADFQMYSQYNDVFDVETFMLGILNLVNTNFDDEFTTGEIQFKTQSIFVSTCEECDPWTQDTDSQVLLESFTEWGTNDGFATQDFDVATLWTDRVMDDSIVGISWIGELCTDFRYNVVQDITENSAILRMLQSHEFGHNFGAVHDTEGSSTIMNPGVNESNDWSIFSFLVINRNIVRYTNRPGCLGACDNLFIPQADFLTDVNSGCLPLTVQFENRSSGGPISYKWVFEGGEPNISFEENPSVVYSESGDYKVTLYVANRLGQDSVARESVVSVNFDPTASFLIDHQPGTTVASFNSEASENGDQFFWDFGDDTFSNERNPVHDFGTGGQYSVTLITRNDCGADTLTNQVLIVSQPTAAFQVGESRGCSPLQVEFNNLSQAFEGDYTWSFEGGTPSISNEVNPTITYNEAGVFNVSLIASSPGGSDTLTMEDIVTVFGAPETSFTVENELGSSVVSLQDSSVNATNKIWRFNGNITVLPDNSATYDFTNSGEHEIMLITNNECGADTLTQAIEVFLLPEVKFDASPRIGCAPLTVQFVDSSEAYKASYLWTVDGIKPDTTTETNPELVFEAPGIYNVKLTLENQAGQDSALAEAFIEVMSKPTADFQMVNSLGDSQVSFTDNSTLGDSYLWDFGDGETSTEQNPIHNYERDGTYPVMLVVENECGRDSIQREINVLFTPTAAFTFDQGVGCSPHDVQFTSLIGNNFGSILWVFDGGTPNESIEENPRITYNEPGQYAVRLFVLNAFGIDSLILEDAISITPSPTSEFVMDVSRNVVEFSNNSLFADQYMWDFGDGEFSTERDPVHSYSNPGNYTVELLSMNQCDTISFSRDLEIQTFVPRAAFTAEPAEGCAPFTVNFINESFNADTYSWRFPGGIPDTSSQMSPVVTYPEPGLYRVDLMVGNSVGTALVERDTFIRVLSGPTANFSFELMDDLTFTATNLSENADRYLWKFGDGFGSEAENPTYQFSEAGMFEVELIAINTCGRDTVALTIDFLVDNIDEPEWASSIKVFPNPNDGRFNIVGEGILDGRIYFELMDLTGRKITSAQFETNNGYLNQPIFVDDIAAGLYLIRLGNESQHLYRKITVLR